MKNDKLIPVCNSCGTPMQDNHLNKATFFCPKCQVSTFKPKDFINFQQDIDDWNNRNWNNNSGFSYWK